METDDKLPLDLTWEPSGHLTEVALTMLADGEQALLHEGAAAHVEGCEACSSRLGVAAMMSLRVGEELPAVAARAKITATAPVDALAKAPAPPALAPRAETVARERRSPLPSVAVRALPIRAIAAAIVISAAGAAPSLIVGTAELPEMVMTLIRALSLIGRALVGLAQAGARGGLEVAPALSWISAGLLVIAGLVIARASARRRVLQEGGM